MLWLLILYALGFMVGFEIRKAFAHEDAAWIQELGDGCCGVTDCERAPKGLWQSTPEGYLNTVTGDVIPVAQAINVSIDEDFWQCVVTVNGVQRIRIGNGGKKCLYPPALGM